MMEPSESDRQRVIIAAAEQYGWLWYHSTDSRRDPAGWPDLVLVKPPRVLFVELKSTGGRVRPEQHVWMAALAECDTIASGYVYPSDDTALLERLRTA